MDGPFHFMPMYTWNAINGRITSLCTIINLWKLDHMDDWIYMQDEKQTEEHIAFLEQQRVLLTFK